MGSGFDLLTPYFIISGQEKLINGRGDPLRWPRDTLYPQKLALTSPTSGGRSVGIVRLRTKGHGVFILFYNLSCPQSIIVLSLIYPLHKPLRHTIRFLAPDLNTETSTSNHDEVFLPFLVQSPWIADPPEFDTILQC
jgi:hypothetical protein